MESGGTMKQVRWIWRHDPTQRLIRICVLEDLMTAFKLSLAVHRSLYRWHREWDGFFVTVLGIRIHYRKAHRAPRSNA
jgi:hypothetical protein